MVLHVAAGVGGPQRRPAGAHGGEERGLLVDAEEALELAGEIRALAVLDQRGGAHRARRSALGALRLPGREQRLKNVRRNRLLVEAEADFDRQPALLHEVGVGIAADHIAEPKRGDLRAVGIRTQTEPAGRRQACMGQRREVRGLRPDAFGVIRGGRRERDDELLFAHNSPRARCVPRPALAGRGSRVRGGFKSIVRGPSPSPGSLRGRPLPASGERCASQSHFT